MGSIWAVARNTIAQAIRLKVALVVVVMLVVLLPLMGVVMIGDGTLTGKLQTFVSYGLSLTSLLLCVLTIAVSCHSLTNDLKRRHIFLVVTKPIHRFQMLCGKFLGIIILNVFLLAVFGAIIYGFTIAIPKIGEFSAEEVWDAQNEFFTSRISLSDPIDKDKIKEKAEKTILKRQESGDLPQDMTYARRRMFRQTIMSEEIGKLTNVQTGGTKKWVFENVRPIEGEKMLFVQYKLTSLDTNLEEVSGRWLIGDDRDKGKEQKTAVYPYERKDAVRIVKEFPVPAEVVSEDGYVAVFFNNPFDNGSVLVPEEVKLLYRAGSFEGNFIRVILVILARLIFLTALGVSVSTWLSFPVALLICVVVFFTGTVNGFIVDSISSVGEIILAYKVTLGPLLWFLPKFDGEFNPTPYMVSGEFLKWSFLSRIFVITGIFKSGVLLMLGMIIFRRREIAKITV